MTISRMMQEAGWGVVCGSRCCILLLIFMFWLYFFSNTFFYQCGFWSNINEFWGKFFLGHPVHVMFAALTKATMCEKINHRWKPQVESQLYDHSNNTHETGQELRQGSKRGKLHSSSESEISFMRIYALNEVVKPLQPRVSKILNCLPQLASP